MTKWQAKKKRKKKKAGAEEEGMLRSLAVGVQGPAIHGESSCTLHRQTLQRETNY